jgi:hypothetical protein
MWLENSGQQGLKSTEHFLAVFTVVLQQQMDEAIRYYQYLDITEGPYPMSDMRVPEMFLFLALIAED